ncbi:phosphoenolpyruvate synthase [Blastococcus sp. URHD0036]|uniref:phosphoenolpyruvate synthase n=1 Tax=Blastococcus sp. URHD0036 TaxID=1380356 RepID=UPI00054F8F7D|nr:phosphoenolpyruvate synthase [Blastococcus sp. URHD0036]
MTATAPHRTDLVATLRDVGLADTDRAGGKGANLGELLRAGLPVPDGFVVLAPAMRAALESAGVLADVQRLHDEALVAARHTREVGHTSPLGDRLALCSRRLRSLVRSAGIPPVVADALRTSYAMMGTDVAVAVRSSAVGEDSADTSFAGMNESLTNVTGPAAVVDAVVTCWASLFSPRSLSYRDEQGLHDLPQLAVVVQRMVSTCRSGVAFTADPVSGRRDRVVVEAAWGQGEVVVGGQVEPDTYLLDPTGPRLLTTHRGVQRTQVVRGDGGGDVAVPVETGDRDVLAPAEAEEIARLALEVQQLHGRPQDVEWAIDDERVWLVQARPITTLGDPVREPAAPSAEDASAPARPPLLTGLGASSGRATGRVRVLRAPDEGCLLQDGEVLVAPLTNPDWMPTMRRAAAVVTDSGGVTCHAAIVARELGVPAVVGARTATTDLTDGTAVTVDGDTGRVWSGKVTAAVPARTAPRGGPEAEPEVTATGLHVNLADPARAVEVAALPVDGVGLLRAELLLTRALDGWHPAEMVARGESEQVVTALADSVAQIARAFAPRPVVYRTADLRTNEFRGLKGGAAYEPVEDNPMIGNRGCIRYVRDSSLVELELAALARVREECPALAVMIPFVRTGWELERCLGLIDASPLGRQRGLRRWVMAEVPSVASWLPEYIGMGIEGVSIGSNDLTQLVLGVDRDSAELSDLFDEADPAVLAVIGQVIATARRLGVPSSLCGQAPSRRPAFVEHLVRAGITSVSVEPGSVAATRRALATAERRVLLAAARREISGDA